MIIAARYSFNRGREYVDQNFGMELGEIEEVIRAIDPELYKTKESKEKTMRGRMLYDPRELNLAFKKEFLPRGWKNQRVKATYSREHYIPPFTPLSSSTGAFRDMDFVKNKLGVEVQFGKYSFMVYNVAAKMTIFRNLGFIQAGVEIVPVKDFVDHMSSGVSYFEQFVWDLEQRGVSNIDVPVYILGIAK